MNQAKILVVDDEPINLKLLREILKNDYDLAFAKSGEEALRLVEQSPPELVLLDIMMPRMDGLEVCRRLKANALTQGIPVIFVTALSDEVDEVEGFKLGAVDYIGKPISAAIVKARVKTHLALIKAQKELINQNVVLEERVKERTFELVETQLEIVQRLGLAAEYRDPETGDHIHRMSHFCKLMALGLGWSDAEASQLLHAAPMHDIGKLGTPDRVLLKPGRLDQNERKIMEEHAMMGERILSGSKSALLQLAQSIAGSHHEKWDGTGYPRGLRGENIPLAGRIAAVADVYDALTSKRPYKEPWGEDEAIGFLEEGRGKHFDPHLVDLFLELLPKIRQIKEQFPE